MGGAPKDPALGKVHVPPHHQAGAFPGAVFFLCVYSPVGVGVLSGVVHMCEDEAGTSAGPL